MTKYKPTHLTEHNIVNTALPCGISITVKAYIRHELVGYKTFEKEVQMSRLRAPPLLLTIRLLVTKRGRKAALEWSVSRLLTSPRLVSLSLSVSPSVIARERKNGQMFEHHFRSGKL